jgi:hypothetical protein
LNLLIDKDAKMYRTRASLFTAAFLMLALTFALSLPVNAQRSDDGAGNSPPIEQPRTGPTVPDATTPQEAAPTPPDENAGQAAPQENNTAVPEENKTPAPDYDTKKEGPPDPD